MGMREVCHQGQLAPNHEPFFFVLVRSSELPLRRDKPAGGEDSIKPNHPCITAAWIFRILKSWSRGDLAPEFSGRVIVINFVDEVDDKVDDKDAL
jgi:hypothetical protein